jgi:hypothetical protein
MIRRIEMPFSRAAASALLLVAALPATAPPCRADGGRCVAAGPAAGLSDRFGRTAPAEVSATGRSRAAPVAAAVASVRQLEIPSLPNRHDGTRASGPLGARERADPVGRAATARTAEILAGFPALSNSGVSPPDPVIAAGPDHLVVAVNSSWAIYTKSGSPVFQTTAFGWFLPQLSQLPSGGLLPYDPQVAYDQFRGRWILLYAASDLASQSWILLSVSSSSDPTAPWYSWALPGDTNGTTPAANFSDYPTLGYDDTAIYVATNQFSYSDTGFEYAKIRVLDKTALYAGATPATWSDFWDLEDPDFPGTKARTLRPAQTFGSSSAGYLVSNSPFATRNFVTLWTVSGAGTSDASLSAADIPVATSTAPPPADQKGGSPGVPGCPTPCLLGMGDGRITSAVSRSGSLWFSHTVADAGGVSSRARYARIAIAAKKVLEDEAFGADGCWFFYPSVAVDAGNNLSMVFGRSCTDAYAGVALTARTTAETALAPSVLLKDGESSYVVPVGDTRLVNRWGEYFGAVPDPADPAKIWVVGAFAGLHNSWRTWVGKTVAALTDGSCVPDTSTLCLGNGRYRVTASWRKPDGSTGAGNAVPITGDTGYFWFFDPTNIEVTAKVLDACGVNGRRWIFSGGLTNLETTLAVSDTQTDVVKTYLNPQGTPFAPIQDTSALTCP